MELDSIVYYLTPYPGPTINTTYFPNTVSWLYLSSNTYAPDTNQAWGIGSQKTIVWETQDIPGDVTIALSLDGGKTYTTITDTEPNDGSYLWTVTPPTVNAMIRIEPNDDPSKGAVKEWPITTPRQATAAESIARTTWISGIRTPLGWETM
jgi:hypothetical protein